jgi:hypothetical protein
MRDTILFSHVCCRKHLHDHIISLRGDVWGHKTSLIRPLFIEVSVSSQENEQSSICMLRVSILPLSTMFLLDFWNCSDGVVFFILHFILILWLYWLSFLAHLTQRVMWGIAITWRPSSVVRLLTFSYFNLLLWNNRAKWNQTWQKASI